MQANSVNFMYEILQNNRFYYIPVYQRNYSWGEEQCKQLFKDIKKLYTGEYSDHFIGTIVWKADDGLSQKLSVIDGQQRLTTMFLLINAMRDLSTNELLIGKLNETIKDNYHNQIRLTPIKSDNQVYMQIVNQEFKEITNVNSRIYQNYLFFKKQIELEQMDIEKLYESFKKLSAIKMELHQNDNPQIIFESINSTGMSLSIADLIRNYLLMNESYDQQKILFEKYWEKFENKLGVENLIYFFEQYLNLMLKDKTINRSKMYQYFKEYFISNNFNAETLLMSVEPYIDVYAVLCNENAEFDFEESKYLNQINNMKNEILQLENRTAYMFLMPTILDYKNNVITIEELHYAFKLVLSYLFRRSFLGLGTNILHGTFRRLHRQVMDNIDKFSYKDALDYALIISKENSRAYFPKDDEFVAHIKERKLYGKYKYTKYFLLSLENNGNKTKFSEEEFSIEHVMPQKITKDWKKELGENWKEIHDEKLNVIGNLTLTSYNSELSNHNFMKKKEQLLDERHIKLNDYFYELNTWNREMIDNRSNTLANMAKELWEYPLVNEKLEEKIKEEKYNSITLEEIIEDYISIKPVVLIIGGIEYQVKSYRDIVKEVIRYSIQENEIKFVEEFIDNDKYSRTKQNQRYYSYSATEEKVIGAKSVEKYYFDSHKSGHGLCKSAYEIIDFIGINPDEVIIKYYK